MHKRGESNYDCCYVTHQERAATVVVGALAPLTSKIVSSQKFTKHSSLPFSPSSFTILWRKARFDSYNFKFLRFENSKSKSLKSEKSVTITRQSTAQPQNKMKQTKAKNTLLLHYVTQYSLTQFVIQCLPKMQLKIWTGILINYWEFLLSQLSVQYFCQVFHQLLLLKWEQIDVIIIW